MHLSAPVLQDLADRYGCSRKTVQRLKAQGIDVSDPEAVTRALISQQKRSTPMLQRLNEILDSLPTDQSPA